MQATGPMNLIFQGTITQLPQAAEEELARERVQRFAFVEPYQNAAAQCSVAKILQQESGPFELAYLCQRSRYLILARVGCQFAHQQRSRHSAVTNGGSHATHVVPLLNDELLIGLVEQQCTQRPRRFRVIEQIQFLGEGVTDARGKAEAEQRCQGKHMLCAAPSVRVMLANMQVALMMAQCVDHVQRLL